jgi:outer membrane receptor protein involved in Fe transport
LDLDPERSVQYEFGVKHQFTDHDAVDITFFNKDVYDYATALPPVEASARRLVYVNSDFSRTRGLEMVVQHRAEHRWGGFASYEYQIATGKPADPNRIKQVDPDALETGEAEPDLTEQFMTWNRPHRLQLSFDYRFRKGDRAKIFGLPLGDLIGANLYYSLRSGRPYTPETILGIPTGKRNSENAPYENVLDLKIDKAWERRGTRFGINFQARNLLGTQILRRVDPSTGEKPEMGQGQYSEAALDRATNRNRLAQSLTNPAFYAEGRNMRLGLEVTF